MLRIVYPDYIALSRKMDYIQVIFTTIGLLMVLTAVAIGENMNKTIVKTIVIIVIAIAIIIILNLLARDFNF